MRSTRLLTRDDVEISIPNAVMGNAKITNESGGPAVEHRIRVPVGVAYGTNPEQVVEILESVAADEQLILERPAARVRMRSFGHRETLPRGRHHDTVPAAGHPHQEYPVRRPFVGRGVNRGSGLESNFVVG